MTVFSSSPVAAVKTRTIPEDTHDKGINEIYEIVDTILNFNNGINICDKEDGLYEILHDHAACDLDNDGNVDLIGGYGSTSSGYLEIYQNDGTPWEPWSAYSIGDVIGYELRLAVGDLNNDGYQDIVSSHVDYFHVWLNDNTPWEAWDEPVKFHSDHDITHITAKDMNKDGLVDIITVEDNEIFIWENKGVSPINFTENKIALILHDNQHYKFDSQIRSISVDDMDNDGDMDIVSVSRYADEFSYNVTFWENDGSPFDGNVWQDYIIETVDARKLGYSYLISPLVIGDVETVDIDNNGYKDIISGDAYGNLIIWYNSGSLKSTIPGTYICNMGDQSKAIACGDIDHDSDIDIVSANDYHSLVVIENPGSNYKSSDWKVGDIGYTTGIFGISNLLLADLDNDFNLDIIQGFNINIWENKCEIKKYIKSYEDIYAYQGTAPKIDGEITWEDGWDNTPTSISSFDDGDVTIQAKHNGTNLFFLIQWEDLTGVDDGFNLYFEDDGTAPDRELDSEHEDFKYGSLNAYGGDCDYRDGCWSSGWPVDGGYTSTESWKNVFYPASSWDDGHWIFEISIPLTTYDHRDINVTGNETLGFVFEKDMVSGGGDHSPIGGDPYDSNTWAELHIEFSDGDKDNDGCFDCCDEFPKDSDEWADCDNDGTGDNADQDDDGDDVLDSNDPFPFDPSEWADSDGDGVGDNSDAFPNDIDDWYDFDGDKVGDNKDAFPFDPTEWLDSDGDGFGDNSDAFPDDPKEWFDFDGDGIGDNSDNDDDNDGYRDIIEITEGSNYLDARSTPDDMDQDKIPDSMDDDIDGDGINNDDDEFPLDKSRWTNETGVFDFDMDNLPDEWELKYFKNLTQDHDDDLDRDGYTNKDEHKAGSDPTDSESTPKTVKRKDSPSEMVSVVIIVAIIIVITILIVIAVMKKRNRSKSPGAQTNALNYELNPFTFPPQTQKPAPTQKQQQYHDYYQQPQPQPMPMPMHSQIPIQQYPNQQYPPSQPQTTYSQISQTPPPAQPPTPTSPYTYSEQQQSCSFCGYQLTYHSQYNRYYCEMCQRYF